MKGPIFGFVLLVIQCLLLIGYVNSNCRPIEVLNYGNFFVPNPLQLVNSEGEITSSNFPNQYNQNEQCGFLIKGPENSRIRLQFTDYQINQSATFGVFDGGCNIIFGFLAIVFISSTFVTGKQIGGRRRIAG